MESNSEVNGPYRDQTPDPGFILTTIKIGMSILLYNAKHHCRAKVNFFVSKQTEQINLPSCLLSFWPEIPFFNITQFKINSAKSACQIKKRYFIIFRNL